METNVLSPVPCLVIRQDANATLTVEAPGTIVTTGNSGATQVEAPLTSVNTGANSTEVTVGGVGGIQVSTGNGTTSVIVPILTAAIDVDSHSRNVTVVVPGSAVHVGGGSILQSTGVESVNITRTPSGGINLNVTVGGTNLLDLHLGRPRNLLGWDLKKTPVPTPVPAQLPVLAAGAPGAGPASVAEHASDSVPSKKDAFMAKLEEIKKLWTEKWEGEAEIDK